MKTAMAANGICDCAAPMNISSGAATEDRNTEAVGQNKTTRLVEVRYGNDALTAYFPTARNEVKLMEVNMMGQVLWESATTESGGTAVVLPAKKLTAGIYVLTASACGVRESVKFTVK